LKGYIQREERNVFFDIDTCKDIDIIPRKL